MSFVDLKEDIENRLVDRITDPADPVFRPSIAVLPANFSGEIPTQSWARLNIFVPGSDELQYGDRTSNTGFIEFNIFVDEGDGELEAMEIADELMGYYIGSERTTQFRRGTIATKAVDSVNPNLFRVDLRIPFTRFN